MSTTPTRRLATGLALALGLALTPTVVGAADFKAPTPAPPPPVGADDFAIARPLLSIEIDDVSEADFDLPGRLLLSAPLDQDLSTTVQVLFPDADPEDVNCPEVDFGSPCPWTLGVDIPAGETEVPFELEILDDELEEDAEVLRAAVSFVHPASAVRLGSPDDAVIYDGAGLELGLVADPEADEGDPGSDGPLDLVVEANQAVPHPVSFRVSTAIVGGYNGATPGVDHEPVDVVVELPAGETTLTVAVPLIGDQQSEADELFFGHLGDLSHGEIALSGGSVVARILDDDAPVVTWKRPGSYQSPSRSARSAALTA
ncbi:MAG TPA: Calx-beta domain-containing protein [Iamia sp.]